MSKYGDPVTDAELLRDLSPITRIDQLTTPLMIVHGENDTNVPVIEAEQVVAALAASGVEHKYLLFPDEGHELLHRSSRAEYLRETVDWLTRLPAHAGVASGLSRTRRSSCALSATTIVDADISTAPTAGLSVNPAQASTPAASGIATTL